mmetsp:Transcript_20161/g.43877  ORF Transcript_20161/g.43877 Transcript_20161/m.43877 type:complete len:124 (+) Transcript_20161:131-502(+)
MLLFLPLHGTQDSPEFKDPWLAAFESETGSLFVGKRRGKEQDQTSKGDDTEKREEVSTEITDTGSDHLRGCNLVREFSDGVFHELGSSILSNHRSGNRLLGDRGEGRSGGNAKGEEGKCSVHG